LQQYDAAYQSLIAIRRYTELRVCRVASMSLNWLTSSRWRFLYSS